MERKLRRQKKYIDELDTLNYKLSSELIAYRNKDWAILLSQMIANAESIRYHRRTKNSMMLERDLEIQSRLLDHAKDLGLR